jgi:hypothetical protein
MGRTSRPPIGDKFFSDANAPIKQYLNTKLGLQAEVVSPLQVPLCGQNHPHKCWRWFI